jgi:hypothetical protein
MSLREGESMATPAANAAFQLCVDFALFPSVTPFPSTFKLAGFSFLELSGAGSMHVIEASEKGLEFDSLGVKITLPMKPSQNPDVPGFGGSTSSPRTGEGSS